MSLITTLGTKIRAAESSTSALDDLKADLLASLPNSFNALDDDKDSASTDITSATTATSTSTPTKASTASTASTASSAASSSSAATTPSTSFALATSTSTTTAASTADSSSSPILSFGSLDDALPGPDDNDDHLSWELGMNSLTTELDSIQHTHNLHHQQLRTQHAQAIAADTTGLTALPHSEPAAAAFHTAVMDTYDRLSGGALGLRGKQAFLSRKLKAKQGRAAKRAEEVYDRQATKLSKGRSKAKARRKAQF